MTGFYKRFKLPGSYFQIVFIKCVFVYMKSRNVCTTHKYFFSHFFKTRTFVAKSNKNCFTFFFLNREIFGSEFPFACQSFSEAASIFCNTSCSEFCFVSPMIPLPGSNFPNVLS